MMRKANNGEEKDPVLPVIITRKIQLLFDVDNKEDLKKSFETIFQWQRIVSKAANWIATHYYVQENLQELFYFTEDFKIKLADAKNNPAGVLKMSRMGTTYQLLSGKFKGQVPMSVISSLNQRIISSFNKEKNEYAYGKKSLRTYKNNLPIPITAANITNIEPAIKNDYLFTFYGLRFKTYFGKDTSNNREIFEKAISGEYKLCDSQLQLKENKIFLLAVFRLPKETCALSIKTQVEASLSIDVPIIANSGDTQISIGARDEFLHRRLAIQRSFRNAQISSRFNRGGKGRQKKLKAIERFHNLETNYINTRLHQYSNKLINFCLQSNAGILILKNQSTREAQAAQNTFVLRNWTYYGLKEKIFYKANKHGIKVIIE